MQFRFSFRPVLLAAVLCTTLACERTAPSNTDPNNQPKNKAEQQLAEFREWVNTHAEKVDSTGKEKGPQIRQEIDQRIAQLDSNAENLSEKSRSEYQELRRKLGNWQARNNQRSTTPLSPETLDRFEQQLLGSSQALDSSWTGTGVQPIYTRFLQSVRSQRKNWTASDWDYVDAIYRQLNAKKDQYESQIPAGDKLKIKALQTEYLTLETAKDTKDLYKELKKD